MLGKSHLLVGAAGYLTVGQTLLAAAGARPTATEMICGTVICAGAAMLPDIDHPQATVARALGPVTWFVSRAANKIFGGHRQGTHSLLFAFAMSFSVSYLLSGSYWRIIEFGLTFFFTSLCVRVLTETKGVICAVISGGVASVMLISTTRPEWLAAAIGLGCILHIAADLVTTEGVPIFWPISKTTIRFPVVGHTGGTREQVVAWLAGVVTVWVYIQAIVLPALQIHF